MPILCLHGIAQENNSPQFLLDLWKDSLLEGFEKAGLSPKKFHLEVPFYGDALANLVREERHNFSADDNLRASGEALNIKEEVAKEIRKKLETNHIDADDLTRGPANSFLQLLSRCLPKPAEAAVIDAVLDQVKYYLTSQDIRRQVLAVSLKALEKCVAVKSSEDNALIVIAHSLGSVIAIDLLANWSQSPIDLLVTVGSPLSVNAVHGRLLKQPPRWPEAVQTWINLSDKDDIVALYGKIDRSNFFSNSGSFQKASRCDVLNVLDVENHMSNHHGIAGYLDDAVLGTIIARALK